ncbi:LytTR family DNA-binding domain-containing protein [Flagellimonas sp. S3867]|uniref:LytR/AlgR family response regulator transcription factor n=1 Tax=Flagellimonas sp. S3867 TaxID=2768063 RepID=UPI00168882A2|nr:LytTR family DNA-binding domain-containing protein [Flagellimonas sp. S3867]
MYISAIVLIAIFAITLVQNIIRYSNHASYSIWISIVYLCVSVLLFIPVIAVSLKIQIAIRKKFPEKFWGLVLFLIPISLFLFYLISNVVLHVLGYFDHYVDMEYARYYFGREALYHLIMLIGSAVYVHLSKQKFPTIDVFKGRKLMTIDLKTVEWIEADGHYANFYVENETYIKRDKLGLLAKTLGPDFVRIHRKYIVNKSQIKSKEKQGRDEYLILTSGIRLKIGQSFKPITW